ncbi:uncharacterized protein EV154DRAFT_599133 [Mucor mucedo]|uniref:uncharacterized protein n=1 Tax=Mucor mucedo TaxID=29922 RepID=UPI00221EF59F|nr:uncharacterized protein EV154DRAFT_599133 [Mucor mucedo]KAI7895529.1 hypothetical protein EV154DRAFT_599133 [Mucor mucedo]
MSCPNTITCTPVAGWLTKMIPLPFGRSRWISRFFVLLDSELRFYKDEHSDTASQILNLRSVCQVIPAPTTQRPFCFRLEPQKYTIGSMSRPWIIECKSETDMENWIAAIQSRITKYASPSSSPSSSPAILSPKTPHETNSTRVVSIYSMVNNVSPEIYRVAALPLRCTNLTFDDQEKESLLIRRNKKLAPIVTQQQAEAPQLSAYSSASSITPSPTGAVLGPLISPSIIERYSQYNHKSSRPLPIITKGVYNDVREEDEPSSPTYLMYKKRFGL